tara:strand:+ start:2657 stop:3637 length:981 start_codon:yes stop_codon:yes gene_type:complete
MADFTNLNLEGANEKLNKALTDAKALKDSLLANHGGDASTILASVESKVSDLQNSFADMIPELPTIPNINMQSEFATLTNFDIGTPQYQSQVANITAQFGAAMKDKGLDIESLAGQIQSGGDVGDLLPNLQLPDGETIPIELPAEVSLPSTEAVEEIIPKVDKENNASLKTPDVEVVTTVSGVTTTTTTTTGGEETIEISSSPAAVSAANERARLKEKLNKRTLITGTFKNSRGRELPLQRMTDARIEELEVRVGLEYISGELQKRFKNKPLSKVAHRIYFQSDTDDAGGRTNESFLAAKNMGDWNWKDDGEYLYYDARYKKNRKT